MTIFGDLAFNISIPVPPWGLVYNHTSTTTDLFVNYTFAVFVLLSTVVGWFTVFRFIFSGFETEFTACYININYIIYININ